MPEDIGQIAQMGMAPPPQGPPDPIDQAKQMQQQQMQGHTQLTPPPIKNTAKHGHLATNIATSALAGLVPFLGSSVQKAVKEQRESQISSAMNIFETIQNENEMAQYVSGGDKQKEQEYLNNSPQLKAIWGDKKTVKQLQKVFDKDLMSPEKQNTVFHDALNRFIKKRGAADKLKQTHQMMARHQENSQQQNSQQQQGGDPKSQPAQQQQQAQPKPSIADDIAKMPKKLVAPDPKKVEESANTVKSMVDTAMMQEPKSEFQAWFQAKRKEDGKPPSSTDIEAHTNARRLSPANQALEEGLKAAEAGDTEKAQEQFDLAGIMAKAVQKPSPKNFVSMIYGANAGNKEDKAALKTYMSNQEALRESYAEGRAKWMYNSYLIDGKMVPLSGLEVFRMKAEGKEIGPPTGRISGTQITALEQLQTEAGPKGSKYYETGALKGIYDNLEAYDNPKNRAIFIKAMSHSKQGGDFVETMKTGLKNVALDQLDDKGKDLYINLNRLAETMGRFRGAMGLPSTDQSMDLGLALMPGPLTTDSKMARKQLDALNQMMEKATQIEMYQGGKALGGQAQQPQQPPAGSGSKKLSIDDAINQMFSGKGK